MRRICGLMSENTHLWVYDVRATEENMVVADDL